MKSSRLAASSIFAAILALAIAGPLWAGFPDPIDDHVNDFGNVLNDDIEMRIHRRLSDTLETRGFAFVVVTVDSIHDYDVGAHSIEEFATALFNTWGVGSAGENRGALLLVAKSDRNVRIELGSGYGRGYDAAMKRVIDQVIVPEFRKGRFETGIEDGVAAMMDRLLHSERRSIAVEQPQGIPTAPSRKAARSSENWSFGHLLSIFTLLAGSGFGLRFLLRRRARSCPGCSNKMRRLNEHEEDDFLEKSQQAEETVGSADYDVWLCDSCGQYATRRFGKFFSLVGTCPKCGYRTIQKSTRMTIRPTSKKEGKRKISRRCAHCSWANVHFETIPTLGDSGDSDDSWSGSSGSFDGGSSSGGGASGSW